MTAGTEGATAGTGETGEGATARTEDSWKLTGGLRAAQALTEGVGGTGALAERADRVEVRGVVNQDWRLFTREAGKGAGSAADRVSQGTGGSREQARGSGEG